jgi:predicted lipid-binding transport protein (Tim44 family)
MRSTRTAPRPAANRAVVHPIRPASAAAAARSRTMRRRRDVLSGLVAAVAATLVLGLLPMFRVMLFFNVIADILLVAYVSLLIHQRNVAAERELKVRFLPNATRLDPALLRAEPALLRRSAN